jgi:hypothetical protein
MVSGDTQLPKSEENMYARNDESNVPLDCLPGIHRERKFR